MNSLNKWLNAYMALFKGILWYFYSEELNSFFSYSSTYKRNRFTVYIWTVSSLKLFSQSRHLSSVSICLNDGRINGKLWRKNTLTYSSFRSAITNRNIYLKSSSTKYLKLFRKYFNLFSYPLTPNNFIYSLSEAVRSFPI